MFFFFLLSVFSPSFPILFFLASSSLSSAGTFPPSFIVTLIVHFCKISDPIFLVSPVFFFPAQELDLNHCSSSLFLSIPRFLQLAFFCVFSISPFCLLLILFFIRWSLFFPPEFSLLSASVAFWREGFLYPAIRSFL